MKIEDLFRYVLADLPDCPNETLRQAFVQVAIDFCQKTHAWSEIADAVRLIDGINEYDIDFPGGAAAYTVSGVWCGPQELRSITMSELGSYLPDWQTARSTSPTFFNMPTDWESIRVYPRPANPQAGPFGSLTLRGVFQPKLNATDLPNWMPEKFLDCLTAGVKGRLMMQPKQKWSEPELGAYHESRYKELRADARISVLAERTPGVTRVKPRAFG